MADQKIKIMSLTEEIPVDTDWIPFIDVSDTTQSPEWSTKRALKSELKGDKGDKGDKWDTGAIGATWPQWSKGDTWDTGATWATGATWPQGVKGDTGDTWPAWADWLDITWLWAYNGATTYAINDAVSYLWSSYICKLASIGNLPTNATYFDLMAQKGDDWLGSGDMLKSVYDPNDDGIVTQADTITSQWDLATLDTVGTAQIDNHAVTNAELAQMNANTVKGRQSGDGTPQDIAMADLPISTATQTALDWKASLTGATFTGDIIVPVEAYWPDWDGSNEVPTKNDIYDKIETLWGGGWFNPLYPHDITQGRSQIMYSNNYTVPTGKVVYVTHVTVQAGSDSILRFWGVNIIVSRYSASNWFVQIWLPIIASAGTVITTSSWFFYGVQCDENTDITPYFQSTGTYTVPTWKTLVINHIVWNYSITANWNLLQASWVPFWYWVTDISMNVLTQPIFLSEWTAMVYNSAVVCWYLINN